MAFEKPREFAKEHKTELVVGSVVTLLGAIGAVASKRLLDNLHEGIEPGPATDDPSDNS